MNLKEFLRVSLKKIGYRLSKYTENDIDDDTDFIEIFAKAKPYTMVSRERSYALYNAIKYIIKNNIPGDFIECGVWRGGSAMIMMFTLMKYHAEPRKLWLYDTYAGMPLPTAEDVSLDQSVNANETWQKIEETGGSKWDEASLEDVRNVLSKTGYPMNNIVFIQGKVEETIPQQISQSISLLRLDTDWYASTKHELEYLYPKLNQGGVLLIDDYGYWEGSRKAVDEFLQKPGSKILLNKTHNGRIGVKVFA